MKRRFAKKHVVIACLVAAATLGASAGCTSGDASTAPAPGRATSSGSRATSASPVPDPGPAVPSLPARALASPGCSSATAAGVPLGSVGTTSVKTDGSAFGVAATPDGRWAFAAASGAPTPAVEVLRLTAGPESTASPGVTRVRSIPLPAALGGSPAAPAGEAVTPDGKYLLVADGTGAVVISAARAETGSAGAVLGTLAAPSRAGSGAGPADSAIEVAVSPDSRFAFVTLEYSDEAVVFNLAEALAHGFGAAGYVGAIPLGQAAVGMAVSPDGRWLYATSEGAVTAQHPVGLGSPGGCQGDVPGASPGELPGTLTVINLRRAETDPAHSVTATVEAGHQPVRVVTSAAGTMQVWVTARASDDLLCFSAARLASDPARALVAIVRVGSEPVGLAAVRGGTMIVVADSNRFHASGQKSGLSVVSVAAALAGRPAIVGDIPTGLFPRDMAISPAGTLLVSDFASVQLEAVATAGLPG